MRYSSTYSGTYITDTIGEQGFGRYREVVVERFDCHPHAYVMSQSLLLVNLGTVLNTYLGLASFEKTRGELHLDLHRSSTMMHVSAIIFCGCGGR